MKHSAVFTLAFAIVLAATGVQSARADEAVDQLVKQVIDDAKSNTERAVRLCAAGKIAKDTPEIQIVLLSKAIEYGMKSITVPEARKTVLEAIALLEKVAPERADEWLKMNLDLHRRWFRACKSRDEKDTVAEKLVELLLAKGRRRGSKGIWSEAATAYREAYSVASMLNLDNKNEIARDLRMATHFMGISQRVERYETTLKTKPDHAATRTSLLKALVVDLDNPGRAAKYLTDEVDQAFRTYVPLAEKESEELQANVYRELGDWYYKALAPKATLLSKSAMLVRARGYYEQFLDKHTTQDVAHLAAKMNISKIDKELEKLATAGMPVVRPRRNRITFRSKQSMAPFKAGKKCGQFPVQKGDDALGPFSGSGVYFDQKTGKDVIYEIHSSRPIRVMYYKGAAIFSTTIEFYSPSGKRLAGMGPLKGGNSWQEFTLKLPRNVGNHVFLKFHNTASTWFYIDTIKFLKK
ncbi:MAG: hypothetical protein QGH60_09830 [Phycisphaerae bacterium]|jgi:hypothetical protein|nr:hypothetical protein [Phycisphaerae bacterium]